MTASEIRDSRQGRMALGRMESFDLGIFRELLDRSGKSQSQLAVDCGVGKTVVSHWVTGRSKPSPQLAPKIAAALGVGVLDLAGKTSATADLFDLRMVQGMTGAQVAADAGIKPYQYQSLEEAISMPKQEHLDPVAPVLEVTVDQVHRAWINRRTKLYGTKSLAQLSDDARAYLAPWSEQ